MSKLVLDSLEIKNFRAFKHLRIEKLGRVNLIVGKNNVGKLSVLEALWLYGRRGNLSLIWDILGARDEGGSSVSNLPPNAEERTTAVRHLFHGREPIWEHDYFPSFHVGPVEGQPDDTFFVAITEPIAVSTTNGSRVPPTINWDEMQAFTTETFSLTAGYGKRAVYVYSLSSDEPQIATYKADRQELNCIFTSALGLASKSQSQLWDIVALTELEEDVLFALRLISRDIERLTFTGGNEPFGRRHPIVKLKGSSSPVPLRSMGEGMNRMFGIALALVNAKDGMLLIDEVDTGLHYSVLPDLWKLIFEVAHRLNVQVFATSHSWDCIQAFQQAAEANKDEEGMLIRLENRDGEVVPVMFDERKLNIAAREQIEVR